VKFHQVTDGDWVMPIMRGYKMQCCDCGLIHTINFKVFHHGRGHKVLLQASRARNHRKKRPT
jgi:hypothetical protein